MESSVYLLFSACCWVLFLFSHSVLVSPPARRLVQLVSCLSLIALAISSNLLLYIGWNNIGYQAKTFESVDPGGIWQYLLLAFYLLLSLVQFYYAFFVRGER